MEKKMIKVLAIFSTVVTIVLVLVLFFASRRINKLKEVENLYVVAQDSLDIVRNKYNQEIAKTEVLTSENTNLFTQLKIKDKDIIRLQQIVIGYEKDNKKINTALIISNETNIKLQDSIRSLIIGYSNVDTPDFTLGEYPIYQRKFKREWDSGEIIIGLDTLEIDIKVRNDYDITIGSEKVSLFKRKLFGNITNLNPNTETKIMKIYQKQEVKDHSIRNAGIFTAIGVTIGLLIK